MSKETLAHPQLLEQWRAIKGSVSLSNPFEGQEGIPIREMWEKLCHVPPLRIALLHLDKVNDVAAAVQISLATTVDVPHVVYYLIGPNSLCVEHPKVVSKTRSQGIDPKDLIWTPRWKEESLDGIKTQGYRLVGMSPHRGENAFKFNWQANDLIVIGPPEGLGRRDIDEMDKMVTIPCAKEVPYFTIPVVLSFLVNNALLLKTGLWNKIGL